MNNNPEVKKSFSASELEALRKLAADYEDALTHYQKQFYKARTINEITVRMITEAVAEYTNRHRGYNHLAKGRKINGNMYAGAPAMKLNESI